MYLIALLTSFSFHFPLSFKLKRRFVYTSKTSNIQNDKEIHQLLAKLLNIVTQDNGRYLQVHLVMFFFVNLSANHSTR